jgi:hypothetical protein
MDAPRVRKSIALGAYPQNLEGRRRAVTQQLQITRGDGQDLVIKIRAAVKSRFGHRWVGLTPKLNPAKRLP